MGIQVLGALELLDASIAAADDAGNRWMQAFAMTEAMWLRFQRGEVTIALEGYREVVETWFRGGDWANQWLSLRQLAAILASCGHDEQAAILFGAVDAAGAASALPFAPNDADAVELERTALLVRLGEARSLQALAHGEHMRDDAVVAHALAAIADALTA